MYLYLHSLPLNAHEVPALFMATSLAPIATFLWQLAPLLHCRPVLKIHLQGFEPATSIGVDVILVLFKQPIEPYLIRKSMDLSR